MSHIIIGKSGTANVALDLDALLRTRLLVQANSGKGKSWLLRRLAEQMFGKVQVIIIDPEGEFASLRERYGYVLVGKGGETPADPRSASLVAHKLLELRASAVCDLYEMKPQARHDWVRLFLDAMIDAPKNLWHPCIIMVDEAHIYCPEKGAGESVASDSVVGMATRGRKRGFALVAATQRLGKLRKDVAAELLNVMIGGTFIDIDRKRAADALGVYGTEQREFFDEIKLLERGAFYALGPAIANERTKLKVGPVETTHPEAGSSRHAAEPPPAPDKIKSLLPKLADLPRAAEERAKTEADLRAEIRSLKMQLRSAPTATREVKVADPKAIAQAVMAGTAKYRKMLAENAETLRDILGFANRIATAAGRAAGKEVPKESKPPIITVTHGAPPAASPPSWKKPEPAIVFDGELNGPQRKILVALAQLRAIGKNAPPKAMVAGWAGYSPIGGAFGNPLGGLRSTGLVDYPSPGTVALTDAGSRAIGEQDAPTTEEIRSQIISTCSGPERKILTVLLDHGETEIAKSELAERSGYSEIGGAFGNPLGALRTKGFLDYPRPGVVKAAEWLFAS